MGPLFAGAVAGLVATAPMSLAMELLHDRLPFRHRHPLPPRHVADRLLRFTGLSRYAGETERSGLAVAGHFGYGAAVGALYGALATPLRPPPVPAGVAFGVAVWAVSYLGWLPLTGLFRHPKHEAGERKALMIAAHVVWGAALGMLSDRLAAD